MSNIIKFSKSAKTIYIGEKHLDFEKESHVEKNLSVLLPLVHVTTDSDGAKYIPIMEVPKIENVINEEKQKSYQAGIEQGHKQGLGEGLKKAEQVLQQLNQAINDIVVQRESMLEEARQKVLDIIIQISKKVTYDAIDIDPEKTINMIARIIDSLIDRSTLKIKVNPDHLPILEQNIDEFLKGSTVIKDLKIEADPRVKYGGCFIETPTGDIDARLESQFNVIEDTLKTDEVEQ